MRPLVLAAASAVVVGAAASAVVDAAAAAPLKAVVIHLIDDLGFHDLGYTGSLIKTPNLDTLRSEGLLLSNYFVTPICTPSRGALMTSRYPLALGLQGGMTIQQMQTWGLNLNETTLADVLSTSSSVQAHAVGKWHLGGSSWAQTPTFRGFQSFTGYYLGAETYDTHLVGQGYDFHSDPTPRCGEGCSKTVWSANGTYSPFLFASAAEAVIRAHDQSKGPLFLYLAWQSVHAPVQAPASYVAPYFSVFNDTIRRVHAGMLALLDEAVGNVTRALQETGLLDSSVVLTSTDNGGPVGSVQPCGDCNGALNYPLRGGKHSLYQGGVKGTGFVWSSALYGTSPANRTWGGLAHITDWFPTILSWLNVSHTQDPAFPIHGYDLSAAIAAAAVPSSSSDASDASDASSSSSSSSSPRPLAVLNIDPTCDGNAAIVTNESMKLLLGDPGPPWGWDPATEVSLNDFAEAREIESGSRGAGVGSRSACSQSWPPTPPVSRLWPLTNTSVYLYNLTADPREMMDVSAAHPALVQQLTGVLAGFAQGALWPVQNATNDPRGDSKLHNGTWVPWL